MAVVGYNILGIGGNCTIHELVIVHILLYQSKMDIGILELCGMQTGNGFHHVVCNLFGCLRGEDYLILN